MKLVRGLVILVLAGCSQAPSPVAVEPLPVETPAPRVERRPENPTPSAPPEVRVLRQAPPNYGRKTLVVGPPPTPKPRPRAEVAAPAPASPPRKPSAPGVTPASQPAQPELAYPVRQPSRVRRPSSSSEELLPPPPMPPGYPSYSERIASPRGDFRQDDQPVERTRGFRTGQLPMSEDEENAMAERETRRRSDQLRAEREARIRRNNEAIINSHRRPPFQPGGQGWGGPLMQDRIRRNNEAIIQSSRPAPYQPAQGW